MKLLACLTALYLLASAIAGPIQGRTAAEQNVTAEPQAAAPASLEIGSGPITVPGGGTIQRFVTAREQDMAAFQSAAQALDLHGKDGEGPDAEDLQRLLSQDVKYTALPRDADGQTSAVYLLAERAGEQLVLKPELPTGELAAFRLSGGYEGELTRETVTVFRGGEAEALFALVERLTAAAVPETLFYPQDILSPLVFDRETGTCAYYAFAKEDPAERAELTEALNTLPVTAGPTGAPLEGLGPIVHIGGTGRYVDSLDQFLYAPHENGVRVTHVMDGFSYPVQEAAAEGAAYERLLDCARRYYDKCPKYAAAFFAGVQEPALYGDKFLVSRAQITHGDETWHVWDAAIWVAWTPVDPASRRMLDGDAGLPDAYRLAFSIGEQEFEVDVTETEMVIHSQGRTEAIRFADRKSGQALLQDLETNRAAEQEPGAKQEAYPARSILR